MEELDDPPTIEELITQDFLYTFLPVVLFISSGHCKIRTNSSEERASNKLGAPIAGPTAVKSVHNKLGARIAGQTTVKSVHNKLRARIAGPTAVKSMHNKLGAPIAGPTAVKSVHNKLGAPITSPNDCRTNSSEERAQQARSTDYLTQRLQNQQQ
ncbi:hypothetical protein ACOMHN_056956 [Nucella lapillus]